MSDLGELDDDPHDPDLYDDEDEDVGDLEDDGEAGEGAPELYFPHVDAFVTHWLAPTYRRAVDGRSRTWCPRWWAHPEAVVRLEALWRAWEHLRLEPALGMSTWLRDHADPHMSVLMDVDGPFKGCTIARGHAENRLAPLALESAPESLVERP